eukprot:1139454-Pelagomonas_calceolata.AAC.4
MPDQAYDHIYYMLMLAEGGYAVLRIIQAYMHTQLRPTASNAHRLKCINVQEKAALPCAAF